MEIENIYIVNELENQKKLLDSGFKWWTKETEIKWFEDPLLRLDLQKKEMYTISENGINIFGKIEKVDTILKGLEMKDWRHAFKELFKKKDTIWLEIPKNEDYLIIKRCNNYEHSNKIMEFAIKFKAGFIYDNNELRFTIVNSNNSNITYEDAKEFIKQRGWEK